MLLGQRNSFLPTTICQSYPELGMYVTMAPKLKPLLYEQHVCWPRSHSLPLANKNSYQSYNEISRCASRLLRPTI